MNVYAHKNLVMRCSYTFQLAMKDIMAEIVHLFVLLTAIHVGIQTECVRVRQVGRVITALQVGAI